MAQHYQLLLQQAVVAIRTAHYQKSSHSRSNSNHHHGKAAKDHPTPTTTTNQAQLGVDWIPVTGGESSDDLAEILDGAVGMLQDLDEVRAHKW